MLIGLGVDAVVVIYRALVTCAVACCALVTISFGLFATDQVSTASRSQVAQLSSGLPQAPGTAPAPREPQPRRFIDGAAEELTSPFRTLIGNSASRWTVEMFSTLLALLAYGVGLGYLARYSRLG